MVSVSDKDGNLIGYEVRYHMQPGGTCIVTREEVREVHVGLVRFRAEDQWEAQYRDYAEPETFPSLGEAHSYLVECYEKENS